MTDLAPAQANSRPRTALRRVAPVLVLALLPACGGGLAEDIAEAAACGLLNCKPSSEVALLLRRADGSQHRSVVRVPAPFRWLVGAAQWSGRSGTVDQQLDLPAAEAVQLLLRGLRCDRSDAQVFERAVVTELGVQPAPVANAQGSLHRVDLPRLAAALEPAALAGAPAGTSVLGCRFELTWARTREGTRAPSLGAQGRIEGRYEQAVAVNWRW